VEILPQRIIGLDRVSNSPIVTTGDLDTTGWLFDEVAQTLTLNNPGGASPLYDITSSEIDLSVQSDVRFTGTLSVIDGSSGNEIEDQFNAFLILDGDTNNPLSLIDRHDIITRDGLLTDLELAPGEGSFVLTLDTIIPASVNSARFVIEAINDSNNETFTISNLGFEVADPALEAYA
jgi:hypothetical protein